MENDVLSLCPSLYQFIHIYIYIYTVYMFITYLDFMGITGGEWVTSQCPRDVSWFIDHSKYRCIYCISTINQSETEVIFTDLANYGEKPCIGRILWIYDVLNNMFLLN